MFARLANQNAKPTRVLAGQKTLLSRTMHDIRYDAIHDELLVTNPFANAVLVYRGEASGEEAPIRVIQGPKTQITGNSDRLDVDPVHNEIYLPLFNRIVVLPREGRGNIPPLRVIQGENTTLKSATSVAVDPVHHVMAIGTTGTSVPPEEHYGDPSYPIYPKGTIVTFNRTDNGNVKPRTVIGGDKTGIVRILQLQVYSPKGWIVATQPGRADIEEPPDVYVGVWSIHDNGEVVPRWKLAGPAVEFRKPRGVVLDAKHKEIIIADMRLNAVLTYSMPEIF